jgi:NADPH:quinone reductase-like Zn-dependent oxidoreductase
LSRTARASSSHSDGVVRYLEGDVYLVDDYGRLLAEVQGLRLQQLAGATAAAEAGGASSLYEIVWRQVEPLAMPAAGADASRRGAWLIFLDRQGVGEALARHLEDRGVRCVRVTHGDHCAALGPDRFCADPDAPADLWCLLGEATGGRHHVWEGVVHLWALDIPAGEPRASADAFAVANRLGCFAATDLVQWLARLQLPRPPRAWLVMAGAQPVGDSRGSLALLQAPLWGLGRVLVREHKEFHLTLVDLDPAADAAESAAAVFREAWHRTPEDQVALRGGRRWVPRLRHWAPAGAGAEDEASRVTEVVRRGEPFRLEVGGRTIEELVYRPARRRPPPPGFVEVEVEAAGLNFSDVLKAIGLYPGITDAVVPLGIECSGRVSAVGAGVEEWAVGAEVMALGPHCFGNYVHTPAHGLTAKPAGLDFESAAAVPVAFSTGWYALHTLGRVRSGDRVLIHAAAGGVGQAAVQIARQAGAEVFATAGSPEKRDFLKSQRVRHVFDSRSLAFADAIRQATDGRGVDLVLNSLPGEAAARSLELLAPYGRFLEIGKTDIYQNRTLGLLPFRNNLSYFAIDMDRLFRERPDTIRELLNEVVRGLEKGELRPLPLARFPITRTHEAFRYMAQRRNIGKVVVSVKDVPAPAAPAAGPQVRPDGTYLITGGLGNIGLLVCGWLVDRGARHLALVGRSAPSEDAAAALADLQRRGAQVRVYRADVARRDELFAAVAAAGEELPPLRGVVHAAGTLADALAVQLDRAGFTKVLPPKVQGAWWLHEATEGAALDFFLLFSSMASVIGAQGQGNYAAANMFLDVLAHHRRSGGLPALTINWGPWGFGGMASRVEDASLLHRGVRSFRPDEGLALLGRLLGANCCQVAAMDLDWAQALRLDTDRLPPMVSDVARQAGVAGPAAGGGDPGLLERLREMSPQQRYETLVHHFIETLARVTGLEAARLDPEEPLMDLGLDSLMVTQFRNTLEASFRISVPVGVLLQTPSIAGIAEKVLDLCALDAGGEVVAEAVAGGLN